MPKRCRSVIGMWTKRGTEGSNVTVKRLAKVVPIRSLSVYELTTGVCRTMPAPACAARRMSSGETGVFESVVEAGPPVHSHSQSLTHDVV